MDERLLEEEAIHGISEYRNLRHRAKRYWSRLAKEALVLAGREGQPARINSGPYFQIEGEVNIFVTQPDTDEECLHDQDLLKLAKKTLPALYRKYNDSIERGKDLREKLSRLRSMLS